jgi:Tol biopolymer transport system component
VTINDLKPTTTPGTPTGSTESQTVYLAGVDGSRLKVIDLPSSVDRRVYWSPNGAYMAYLLPDGDAPGLYVIDLELSTSTRLFAIRDLSPRGVSITPTWSPDSKTIAVTLPKPYEFDIFTVGADAGRFTNLTSSESVEMWAAWSPDGSMIAFVSDRIQCPSYLPSATPTCTPPGSDPKSPEGGNLYVFDVGTKQTRFLSDQWVIAPPKWISPTRIGFTSGARNDPTAGNSLGWVEARGGSVAVQVTTPGNAGTPRYANSEFWSPDASKVIYQEYETTTRIVIRDANGNELARSNELNFPRYLFAAAWTPNSERVVLGGRNAQCPFGMLITDGALKTLMTAAAGSVGVCNPVWSSDGRYVLYEGTSRGASRDGRVDIYLSETSGYGARALSSRLSGQIKLLGWVGR